MNARPLFTTETEQNFELYLDDEATTNRQLFLFTSSKRAEYHY
jgi:hypothetical protein